MRIRGKVTKIPEAESAEVWPTYLGKPMKVAFSLGGQSSPIPDREYFTNKAEDLMRQLGDKDFPMPSHW